MGFGFAEFYNKEEAVAVIKKLQGEMLDGHALQLKFSQRKKEESAIKERKITEIGKASTKLLIKNVPFEATKKELRDYLSTFGQLKRVALPKKFGGGHRGFAFAEFTTKQEAKNAFDSLSISAHFYGRRLVFEYAKQDQKYGTYR